MTSKRYIYCNAPRILISGMNSQNRNQSQQRIKFVHGLSDNYRPYDNYANTTSTSENLCTFAQIPTFTKELVHLSVLRAYLEAISRAQININCLFENLAEILELLISSPQVELQNLLKLSFELTVVFDSWMNANERGLKLEL